MLCERWISGNTAATVRRPSLPTISPIRRSLRGICQRLPPGASRALMETALLGFFYRPPFPNDCDLHLARIVEALLDALADLLGHSLRAQVVHLLRLDDDANLAPRLYGERLVHAREAVSHRLQRLQPLDVAFQRLPPSAR